MTTRRVKNVSYDDDYDDDEYWGQTTKSKPKTKPKAAAPAPKPAAAKKKAVNQDDLKVLLTIFGGTAIVPCQDALRAHPAVEDAILHLCEQEGVAAAPKPSAAKVTEASEPEGSGEQSAAAP